MLPVCANQGGHRWMRQRRCQWTRQLQQHWRLQRQRVEFEIWTSVYVYLRTCRKEAGRATNTTAAFERSWKNMQTTGAPTWTPCVDWQRRSGICNCKPTSCGLQYLPGFRQKQLWNGDTTVPALWLLCVFVGIWCFAGKIAGGHILSWRT